MVLSKLGEFYKSRSVERGYHYFFLGIYDSKTATLEYESDGGFRV